MTVRTSEKPRKNAKLLGVKKGDIAKMIGVLPSRVTALCKDGTFTRLSDGSYDPQACIEIYRKIPKRIRPIKAERELAEGGLENAPRSAGMAPRTGDHDLDYLAARAENERQKARQNELKTAQLEARLLDGQKVKSVAFKAGRLVRDKLLTLSDAAPSLVGKSVEDIRDAIDSEVRDVLQSLEKELAALGGGDAVVIDDQEGEENGGT